MRPTPSRRVRRLATPMAVAMTLTLVVTACTSGGGDGGGGGNQDYILRVLVVNEDAQAHTLTYSGGAPLEDSPDPETVESCMAGIVWYAAELPFELLIDDVPIIISDELEVPAPEETDLVATINISQEGVAEPDPGDGSRPMPVTAGRNLNKPASIGLCL